jgi:TPR repeat protein
LRLSHFLGLSCLLGLRAAPTPTPSALESACLKANDAEACESIAEAFEQGARAPRFAEEAGLWFALGCEAGLPTACTRAAPWSKRYPDYEVLEIDAGCMLRDNAFACEEVARELQEDDEGDARKGDAVTVGQARLARAVARYRADCDRDDAAACLGVSRATRAMASFGIAADVSVAERAEEKSCALGLGAGCELAGDARAPREAIPFYRRACELPPSAPHACLKLARGEEALGAPAARVIADYESACRLLAKDACDWLAAR